MEEVTTKSYRKRPPAPDSVIGMSVWCCPDASQEGRFAALPQTPMHIGRDAAAGGLFLPDPEVSRRHATVRWQDDAEEHVLYDEGSRNGTFVNGQQIERESLAPGDIIRCGNTVLCVSRRATGESDWQPPAGCLLKGRSSALAQVSQQIDSVADSDFAVLILGETGTGKEVVAQEVHRRSGRRGAFVAVNCAGLNAELAEAELFGHCRGAFSGASHDSKGLVRTAKDGTLFLDEVGELPPVMQPKLLRLLEHKHVRPVGGTREEKVDVRFVFATNRDLDEAVRHLQFRKDLFSRLRQCSVSIPPLRERLDDLMPIIRHLLQTYGDNQPIEVSGEFFEALALYRWPYNVRELVQLIRTLVKQLPSGGLLSGEHLPAEFLPSAGQSPSDGLTKNPS